MECHVVLPREGRCFLPVLALVILVFGSWSAGCESAPPSSSLGDQPALFSLRYGDSLRRSALIFSDGDSSRVPFAWSFWMLQDRDGTTLIDSGITDEKFIHMFGIKGSQQPDALLASVGVKASDVHRIVLTHLHADHVDGVSLFPNAELTNLKSTSPVSDLGWTLSQCPP